MTPYLDIQHLTKSIGDLVLFEDISFSVAEGQHVGLIARNGAGKSTLLSIISGKDSADDGQIVFMKGLRIGLLEQQPVFDPQQTVIQAVTSRLKSDYASLLISEYGSQLSAHTAALDADGKPVGDYATSLLGNGFNNDWNQNRSNKTDSVYPAPYYNR